MHDHDDHGDNPADYHGDNPADYHGDNPADYPGDNPGDPPGDDPSADPVDDLVADLHAHLAATAERPIEREASRWLGEAEAVVDDVAGADVDPDILQKRVEQARDLLEHIDETGDPAATEHVEAAHTLTERILTQS